MSQKEIDTITINDVEYVRKDSICQSATKLNGMPYCIVRTQSAGVFAGYIESQDNQRVIMRDSRRIWFWDGASSLSGLAIEGTSKPQNCKFPIAVDRIELLQAIEILSCTEKAKKCIQGVPVWRQ